MCLPTHKVVSVICSFWAASKISEKKTVQMREENAQHYCMTSFLRRKYTRGEKLPPASLSQKFPNFQWAKTEEAITSNESRTIDAETMNTWNSQAFPFWFSRIHPALSFQKQDFLQCHSMFHLVMPHTWNQNSYPFAPLFSQMSSSK